MFRGKQARYMGKYIKIYWFSFNAPSYIFSRVLLPKKHWTVIDLIILLKVQVIPLFISGKTSLHAHMRRNATVESMKISVLF